MITKKPYVITSITKTTPDVTLFRFKAADGSKLEFTPGMFVMLYYRDETTNKDVGRAYSIASSPNSDELEFAISMMHGRFTSQLENAKTGDTFYISGPYGQFKFSVDDKQKYMFLAGGTGLAPFMSMFKATKEANMKVDAVLFYSVRHPDEIIAKEELEATENATGVKMVVTVTRPQESDAQWDGETGHINADMVKRHLSEITDRECYICGPPAFVKALKTMAIELGMDPKKIVAEMWG